MGYWDDEKNVDDYIDMAEGYDGRELVGILRNHLEDGATVLELGMGPGKDLDLLASHYRVVGSDSSRTFLDKYREAHPDADLLLLDAATIDTDRRFDAIYSNKVLHHLTRQALAASFQRQVRVLNSGGILLHSFWYGDREEEMHGLRFVYYTEDAISQLVADGLALAESKIYTELEEDDSLWVVLKKRK
jgi:cyclopropane fatty-acyl-phospholipid synthase-like methyltransferase